MSIVLNFLYMIALLIFSPILLYRIFAKGKYWESLQERLGKIPFPLKQKCIWLHGVSVGEIKASQPLVNALQKNFPHREMIISVTSKTGKEIARQMYPNFTVVSFPLDFSWVIRKFLKHFDPALVILMELELWPNFLGICHQNNIPVVLVNGRLSERSFRGYRRYLGKYFVRMTQAIRYFGVQCELYSQRFQQLGISNERLVITGNIKFDAVETEIGHDSAQIREKLGIGKCEEVIICGSTHPPEEKWILKIWSEIYCRYPNVRLICVPRNPQRAEEVGGFAKEFGFSPIYRTKIVLGSGFSLQQNEVIIVDTIGELKNLYRIAVIAIIGGSFIQHGGQNFIEPAGFGKAVLCGPSMQNFPDIKVFREQNAIIQVSDYQDLGRKLEELLQSSSVRESIGKRALDIVYQSKGSTSKNMELCKKYL